jgi:hypothetical protein
MNANEIIRQLRAERDKLDAAIQTLEGINEGVSGKRRGRPPGTTNRSTSAPVRKGRGMSPAARKRIAAAMKARWAAAKKSGKKKL